MVTSNEKIGSSPSLGELLFSPESQDVTGSSENFAISSIDKAIWAARKVVEARTRISSRKALADSYKARIDMWLEKSNTEDNDSLRFFMNHLKPYAEREIAKQRKSKTLILPGVSLSLRKKPDRLEILNEDEVIAYCETFMPKAIVVKKSISKTVLKASILTGTLPPSVEFIPGEDELYVSEDSEEIVAKNQHVA